MRNKENIFFIFIFLSGIFVRIYYAYSSELYNDELFSLYNSIISTHGLGFIDHFISINESNPLLHFIFIRFSVFLFGLSEIFVRLPFLIFGILSIPSAYYISSKVFDKYFALLFTIIISFSPAFVFNSIKARPYSILIFVFLWLFYFIYKFCYKKQSINIYFLFFLMFVFNNSHYLSFIYSFIFCLVLLIYAGKSRLRQVFIYVLISFISILPSLVFFILNSGFRQISEHPPVTSLFLVSIPLYSILGHVAYIFGECTYLKFIQVVFSLLFLLGTICIIKFRKIRSWAFYIILVILSYVVLSLASSVRVSFYRYYTFLFIFISFVISYLLYLLPYRKYYTGVIIILLIYIFEYSLIIYDGKKVDPLLGAKTKTISKFIADKYNNKELCYVTGCETHFLDAYQLYLKQYSEKNIPVFKVCTKSEAEKLFIKNREKKCLYYIRNFDYFPYGSFEYFKKNSKLVKEWHFGNDYHAVYKFRP